MFVFFSFSGISLSIFYGFQNFHQYEYKFAVLFQCVSNGFCGILQLGFLISLPWFKHNVEDRRPSVARKVSISRNRTNSKGASHDPSCHKCEKCKPKKLSRLEIPAPGSDAPNPPGPPKKLSRQSSRVDSQC